MTQVPTNGETAIVSDVPGAAGRHWGEGDGWHWGEGEATAAMTDIGDAGAGPRAQLVIYARPAGDGETTHAASIELTPDEARTLAFSLLGWADEATGEDRPLVRTTLAVD